MKAFLLAAGLGTRLRPLTNETPKCLIQIKGKPLLVYWIELITAHGINEVLINLHYLPNKVKSFIKNYPTSAISFTLFEEPTLLGSAGTLKANKDFVANEENFFILYADNLTNINLTELLNFHKKKEHFFTMALNRVSNPSICGIATLDENDTITSFIEKPQLPTSNLANAGVYVAKPEVLDFIPSKSVVDIGFDLLPQLVGKMAGWETSDLLIDIGTFDNLRLAEKIWT